MRRRQAASEVSRAQSHARAHAARAADGGRGGRTAAPTATSPAKFSISPKTVKHHLTNIFDKLGVSNRLALALFAVHRRFDSNVLRLGTVHASRFSLPRCFSVLFLCSVFGSAFTVHGFRFGVGRLGSRFSIRRARRPRVARCARRTRTEKREPRSVNDKMTGTLVRTLYRTFSSFSGRAAAGILDAVKHTVDNLIGVSSAMQAVRTEVEHAARCHAKVLLTGESGVGKEVASRSIHCNSSRARVPLVAINCVGIPESLLESELFGHVRGSFTGAHRDRVGPAGDGARRHGVPGRGRRDGPAHAGVAAAVPRDRGDRSGSAPIASSRGSTSASSRRRTATCWRRWRAKNFREDLYYRLNVIEITIPPLRDAPRGHPGRCSTTTCAAMPSRTASPRRRCRRKR